MPILDIEIVASDSDLNLPTNLTQSLADTVAQIFDSPPGRVWVKLRMIPTAGYAENGDVPGDMYPVFVTVFKARVPEGSELEDETAFCRSLLSSVGGLANGELHRLRDCGAGGSGLLWSCWG